VSHPDPGGFTGPLAGLSVLELAGQGPGPYAGMLLADMGASVVKVDRPEKASAWPRDQVATDLMDRGKRSVAINLRHPDSVEVVLRLVERSDVVIDPFRPGVVERLGIGPDRCLAANPSLIFARMTGWGQDGPLAHSAGHDINYISLSGGLDLLGEAGRAPQPPLNILGDFAGGGILLAFGIMCAAYETGISGKGQVVDAAMVDGSALVMAPFISGSLRGNWGAKGTNFLDGAAHFYGVYRTADDRYLSVGAIEPNFYAELLKCLGLDPEALGSQWDRDRWPSNREVVGARVASRALDEWLATFEGTDACVTPVLTPTEAASHPHIRERGTFVDVDGLVEPGPAPRFSRTTPATPKGPCFPGQDTEQILADAGLTALRIEELRTEGVIV
jgi:alpha-methylacyl-CoA racemase